MGDAIGSVFDTLGQQISNAIWNTMLRWFYETIYGAVADFFTLMGNMGADIFDLQWVQATIQLFTLFGWALFIAGVIVAVFDVAVEYQCGRANIKTTAINILKGFFACSLKFFGIDSDDNTSNEYKSSSSSSCPETFKKVTRLSQHIAFLKDFFRSYKDFTDEQIDTIEILLSKLYTRFGITDSTDYSKMKSGDYPIMSDLYELCKEEYKAYDYKHKYLYTEETLQKICLGIHSMCVGSESKYFNGHSNITDDKFLVFGVKGLMDTNRRLKDAMLFNLLSFMSNQLLCNGNTIAAIDELYMYLTISKNANGVTNNTAIEYIRNCMKRVRKKDSAIIIASQNINDFLMPDICELTKPLFAIPTHQFFFNPGSIDSKAFIDTLQLEPSEYELIKQPERGTCLYRCGNERYLLQVIAPEYKSDLFGNAGGR